MLKFHSIGIHFFEELEGRDLPPMQLKFEIALNADAELLFGSVDTTRVTIDRFYLWVPKILPKDSLMTKYVSDFKKPSRWKYLKENHYSSAVTRHANDFELTLLLLMLDMFLSICRSLKQMK